eukprot:SM000313S11974  [mRNA]  locus=s313:57890:61361:- [translate_table: standard]
MVAGAAEPEAAASAGWDRALRHGLVRVMRHVQAAAPGPEQTPMPSRQPLAPSPHRQQRDADRTSPGKSGFHERLASWQSQAANCGRDRTLHLARDPACAAAAWERQHESAADKLHALCVDLGGFYLKGGQFLAKPDLVPAAWVRRLSVLHDAAPATPFRTARAVVEAELGADLSSVFDHFDATPVGSASVAQVHRARLRRSKKDVAVKVQHPGSEHLMMTDLRNLRSFAGYLQRYELSFDLLSVVCELQDQVQYEFDFQQEAASMDAIGESLAQGPAINGGGGAWWRWNRNKNRSPIIVPRSVPGLVTRRLLVMDFVEGTPIARLSDEMQRRGISPDGLAATAAKKSILRDLSAAYGHMILSDGHFQADPHPGNILVCRGGKVALLDYGQTKVLPDRMRLALAGTILAICADDTPAMASHLREMGIETEKDARVAPQSFRRMAHMMFDTETTAEFANTNPFSSDSSLKSNPIKANQLPSCPETSYWLWCCLQRAASFPKDMFFVLRTIQLLRGLSYGMGVSHSVAKQWRPLAEQALEQYEGVAPLHHTKESNGASASGTLMELSGARQSGASLLPYAE